MVTPYGQSLLVEHGMKKVIRFNKQLMVDILFGGLTNSFGTNDYNFYLVKPTQMVTAIVTQILPTQIFPFTTQVSNTTTVVSNSNTIVTPQSFQFIH
ncbi:MAG: hypothetical protein IPN88_16760 [Bacteroidetes bacterium]|nr:hypothetical protein [Bacteroidota bacterium]